MYIFVCFVATASAVLPRTRVAAPVFLLQQVYPALVAVRQTAQKKSYRLYVTYIRKSLIDTLLEQMR